MRKLRLGKLGLPAVLSAFSISSCIADGDTTNDPAASDVTSAGAGGDAGTEGDANGGFAGVIDDIAAGEGGSEPTLRGGTSNTGESGGSGRAPAGEGGNPGGSAGAQDRGGRPGEGARGGGPSDGGDDSGGRMNGGAGGSGPPPPFEICMRLLNPTQKAFNVTEDYWAATTGDCRISWVSRLYGPDEVQTFLNRFLHWNRAFWGCIGTEPPENFGLMYTEVPITAGDADVLIGMYMGIANTHLEMSSDEMDAMRRQLDRLAERVIESDSHELSNSTCVDNTGGAGGAP